MEIGDGTHAGREETKDQCLITIPSDMIVNNVDSLIRHTFPTFTGVDVESSAILAPKNELVFFIRTSSNLDSNFNRTLIVL